MSLERLCEKAGFGSADELVSAYLSRHSVVEEAIAEIARRGLGKVSNASILMPDFFGGAVTVEAIVSGWEAKRTAWDATVRSRELEARKEKERSERLEREYDFIVRKALDKAAAEGIKAPPRDALSIEGVSDTSAVRIRDLIAEALSPHPYLHHVVTDPSTNAHLWVSGDGRSWKEWRGPYEKWERKRQIARRAKATDAFGEDPAEHWGVVKSRLLRRLKPEVLGILHRQDIQELLDLARAEGDAFVVFGDWGFLWNPERERWEQREFERPETDGSSCCRSRRQTGRTWTGTPATLLTRDHRSRAPTLSRSRSRSTTISAGTTPGTMRAASISVEASPRIPARGPHTWLFTAATSGHWVFARAAGGHTAAVVQASEQEYRTARVCKPHDCGDNRWYRSQALP
jgi:hypothetical protein